MDAEQLKSKVIREIDSLAPELLSASHAIHEYAEMAFKEYKSAALLEDLLEKYGLTVERGIAGMETAFRGMYRGKGEGPTIAILGEYDALPHGHACGHNIIGVAAAGAGIALAKSLGDVPGNISVLGCPAEEGGGGKVFIAKEGYLNGVDAALMAHPIAGTSMIGGPNLAVTHFTIKYHGKAAHAASDPHEGINALDAMILGFQNVNALRQHVTGRKDARIYRQRRHSAQRNPRLHRGQVYRESRKRVTLDKVAEQVENASLRKLATGATLEFDIGYSYSERVVNMTIARKVQANLRALGVEVLDEPVPVRGSTDFGDVSQLVPAVNLYIQIAPDDVASHSNEMREAAKSPAGDEGLLKAAKAMAMTAVDLLTDPALVKEAWEEHERTMASRR